MALTWHEQSLAYLQSAQDSHERVACTAASPLRRARSFACPGESVGSGANSGSGAASQSTANLISRRSAHVNFIPEPVSRFNEPVSLLPEPVSLLPKITSPAAALSSRLET